MKGYALDSFGVILIVVRWRFTEVKWKERFELSFSFEALGNAHSLVPLMLCPDAHGLCYLKQM